LKNLTPLQRVVYLILDIYIKQCRQLEYFSVTLRNFENPHPVSVHIKVNRDDVFRSSMISETAYPMSMEMFGDMSGCSYEGMRKKVHGKFRRPQYKSRKD
jgi:hypothetical protein